MSETSPDRKPRPEIVQRAREILARMTLDEKIGQLHQTPAYPDRMESLGALIKAGSVGSLILASSAFAGTEEQNVAELETLNAAQRIAVNESRLGVPLIFGRDVIHGHRTLFPIPLGQAASWDMALVEEAARIAAREAASRGIHWTFAPMLDIARDPRWGRVSEGAGEDPYLASRLAEAMVHGFQGRTPEELAGPERIVACAKHYVGYGAAIGGRDYDTTEITDNTLRNTYLPPFRAAVDAGVRTVMSGFHDLNGESASGSRYLLTEILRDELGFAGFVVSDWESVAQNVGMRIAADREEAAAISVLAGVDMDMTSGCYLDHLYDLVETGTVPESVLDEAVLRVLVVKLEAGLFENPYTDIDRSAKVLMHADHRKVARDLAARSVVLLKNTDVLPISDAVKKIAVIGPLAEAKAALRGSWSIDGDLSAIVDVASGIKAARPDAELLVESAQADLMVHYATSADVVVVVVGENPIRSGEANDVAEIVLPPGQEQLLEAIAMTGKPVIAVVIAGRPLAIPRVLDLAAAVLYAFHPGTEGGNAIADVISGRVNPSGKLPITMPRSTGQIPVYYNRKSTGRPYMLAVGGVGFPYRDIDAAPLFPFGYGLSYATFSYSGLRIACSDVGADGMVRVSATVANTGTRAGEEVVQCYIQDNVSALTRPVRELVAYERLKLAPGESRDVEFTLGAAELGYFGRDGKHVVESGAFTVWVGGSSDAELSASCVVGGCS
ncbi:MAG: beta-glucosidase [Spirochaetaceae bacterium]|nr:MAG: beta-glucosidase [Spirochaetaceae bacterium]